MVKLLGKTIRQLSEELKLSKQGINQRINSINGFRSKHTYKVKNHLEIDNRGVKMLANFDKQKRQERQPNRQAENCQGQFKNVGFRQKDMLVFGSYLRPRNR